MKYFCPHIYVGIFIAISAIFIVQTISQSSNAQFQESAFNSTKPLIDSNSGNTQQTFIHFSPEHVLIANGHNSTHFVWEEIVNGKSEILYTKRNADGFFYKTNLSLSSSVDSIKPNILVDNRNIYLTWWEKFDNGTQIPMFRASSDNGSTFGAITTLSNIPFR
jgi:hypothetical protein